jgi:hypothetical protein
MKRSKIRWAGQAAPRLEAFDTVQTITAIVMSAFALQEVATCASV